MTYCKFSMFKCESSDDEVTMPKEKRLKQTSVCQFVNVSIIFVEPHHQPEIPSKLLIGW